MNDLESIEPYAALAVALAVGLLVGVERERTRPPEEEKRFFGGIRTYPLFSLLGALSTLLAPVLGPWPFVLATVSTLMLVGLSYRSDLERGHHGLTSEGAFLVVFLLGALSTANGVLEPFSRRALTVSAVAVVVTFLLSAKVPLHQLSQKLSREDVIAAVKLLIVGVVVLPLLPNKGYGPWEALNPFSIGKMVALIAAVGFAGWAATRVLGPNRGMLLTGAVGGLVSSTAVTLSAGQRAKEQPALAAVSATAAVLASTLMVMRVAVVSGVVHAKLALTLAIPLGAMTVGGAAFSYLLYRKSKPPKGKDGLEVANPFELGSALKFTALYVAVILVSRAGLEWFGESANYVTGILAGLTDVDAITISMAQFSSREEISLRSAAITVFLAMTSNTLVKSGMAAVAGGAEYAKRVIPGLMLMLVLGAGALVATLLVQKN
jgi:uncharacterized membrane protein (DUF4010 family)